MGTVSTNSTYTFTVTGNRSLTAVFEAVIPTYTITAAIDPPEAGSVTGAGQYQEGETVTLTAAINDGYSFTGWQENGETVSTDNPYTFTAEGDREFTASFAEKPASRLPAGYTEVEYIEASSVWPGGQYIDTRFVPNQNTRIIADFQIVSLSWQFKAIFGERSDTGDGFFLYSQDGIFTAMYGNSYIGIGNTVSEATERHICDLNKNVLTFDETTKTFPVQNFTGAETLTLCCLNQNGSQSMYGNIRCFSCQIYNNGIIARDLVPCINPKSAVGLYDLVSGDFYGNAGTGTFAAGPAV